MRSEVTQDTSTRRIVITVTEGPEADVSEEWDEPGSKRIEVERVQVQIRDGVPVLATISGPVVKKDGSLSETRTGNRSYGRASRLPINAAPEWVQRMFTEAPAGVTSWAE